MKHIQTLLLLSTFVLCASASAAETMWRYTVRPGDNLITLGKKHLINANDWIVLQRINRVQDPYRLPIGSVLRMPLTLIKQSAANAEVIFVSGQAHWQQSATHWAPLQIGKLLGPGAVIATKENSKVVLQFADGSTTNVVSNSTLSLDALSLYSGGVMIDTRLRLQKGQIETQANPNHIDGNQMQVITPSAIAAVRGTMFRVTTDDKATTQETLDGRVALNAASQEVMVNKGFGSKAEQGKQPISPVVLLPAVDTTNLKAQYVALPVTFDVPQLEGAESWVVKIATDANFNQLVAEDEFNTNQLVFADVPDGRLYLNLRAKNSEGIVGYEAVHAFNVNARPFQPEIISPTADAIIREAWPTLQWQMVADAQQYTVEVANDATFNQLIEAKQLDGLSLQLDKPLTPGQYYWRVISLANADDGQLEKGPALQVNAFSYKAAPVMPDISQLSVNVARNRVFVQMPPLLSGLSYHASLDNPFNHQVDVWHGAGLANQFHFLLKEYGKQTLYIRHVDSDGIESEPAIYEFDAQPE